MVAVATREDGPAQDPQSLDRRRRPRRPEVRARLLEAARAVFAEKGYEAASVADVAAAAGLTKGAVYSNFAGKEELFLELLRAQVAARAEVLEALDGPPIGVLAIGQQLTGIMDASRDWHLLFNEFWLMALRHDVLRELLVAERRRLHAMLTEAIERRIGAGDITPALSAGELATVGMALSNGLAFERLLDRPAVGDDLFGRILIALADPDHGP
jgi:AcrR family transcriptional regulator